jgi:hypothetical protein
VELFNCVDVVGFTGDFTGGLGAVFCADADNINPEKVNAINIFLISKILGLKIREFRSNLPAEILNLIQLRIHFILVQN